MELLRVMRYEFKPEFVPPERRWAPPEDMQARVDAFLDGRTSTRVRRSGGQYRRRARPIPIQDQEAGEEADILLDREVPPEVPGEDEPAQPLPLEDIPPNAPVPVPEGRRKRRRVEWREPAPQPDADDTALFTPSCVSDGVRCMARTWGAGRGGQCIRAKPGRFGSMIGTSRESTKMWETQGVCLCPESW